MEISDPPTYKPPHMKTRETRLMVNHSFFRMAVEFSTKFADLPEHVFVMRAAPIDFHAILALPEFPESLENFRVNLPPDDGLVDRVNPAVAIHAACKGL